MNLGFINLTTASDKLAANELGWSVGMLLGGALMSTIGAKLIRNNMRVVAFGIALVASPSLVLAWFTICWRIC